MTKQPQYEALIPQIRTLIQGETDSVAIMANVAAAIYTAFHFWWVGFYRVVGDELVLGPFQGPIACTRIAYGRGVCGSCWQQGQTIVVPDVHLFPDHIACSSESKSEIVAPIWHEGHVVAVLDVDSDQYNAFDAIDHQYLEQICTMIPI